MRLCCRKHGMMEKSRGSKEVTEGGSEGREQNDIPRFAVVCWRVERLVGKVRLNYDFELKTATDTSAPPMSDLTPPLSSKVVPAKVGSTLQPRQPRQPSALRCHALHLSSRRVAVACSAGFTATVRIARLLNVVSGDLHTLYYTSSICQAHPASTALVRWSYTNLPGAESSRWQL